MTADRSNKARRKNEKDRRVLVRGGARRPLRKQAMKHATMKQILIFVCIGLFAVFCAGCTTNDAGTTGAENQSAVATHGNAMPANATEQHIPPSGEMNETAGSTGSMPPGFQVNSTDGHPPLPPGGMSGTPGEMGSGSMLPGQAPPDRPDMNQTGVTPRGAAGP
jgi:hypothetical protein